MTSFLFGVYLFSHLGGCGEWSPAPYPLALSFQRHVLYPECDYGPDSGEWTGVEAEGEAVFVSGVMLVTQQAEDGICGFRLWFHKRADQTWPDCQVVSAHAGGERSGCATWAPIENGKVWARWVMDGDATCSVGGSFKMQAIQ